MKAVGKIFAILFSIVYFFLLTALMIVSFSLNLLSSNYYSNVLGSIDLKTIKVSDLEGFFDMTEFDKDTTVEDVLIKYFEEGGIDKELATEVINNKKIKKVVGKFIGDYINYNVSGEKPKIKKKDIEELFNEPEVKKLIDQSEGDINVDIDIIYEQLNELIDEMVEGGDEYDGNSERINNNYIVN